MNLTDKVALVTGAGRGLGRAIAVELAKAGAKIAINYIDNKEDAEETLRLVNEHSSGGIFNADVSQPSEVQRMVEQIVAEYGRIDVLVNNAGVILRPGNWDQQSDEDMARTIDVNLKGQLNCIRAIAPIMQNNKSGRIVNIASTNGQTGTPAILAYSAAKAGVINATLAMAKALANDGVTVNTVSPGVFDTDMTHDASEELVKWTIDNTPLGRLGEPREIGEAVKFLAESDFITGHVLVVDGGFSLK